MLINQYSKKQKQATSKQEITMRKNKNKNR